MPDAPLPANAKRFIRFRVLFNARFYYPVLAVLFVDLGLTLDQFALLNVAWAVSIVLSELPLGSSVRTVLDAGRWIAHTRFALGLVLFALVVDSVIRLYLTLTSAYFRLLEVPASWYGPLADRPGLDPAAGDVLPPARVLHVAVPEPGHRVVAAGDGAQLQEPGRQPRVRGDRVGVRGALATAPPRRPGGGGVTGGGRGLSARRSGRCRSRSARWAPRCSSTPPATRRCAGARRRSGPPPPGPRVRRCRP